jgi:hypothetical protein
MNDGTELDIIADWVIKRDGYVIFLDQLGAEVQRLPVENVISYGRG